MSLQYVGLNEINGPLVVLDHVKGASYDEMVDIQLKDGTTRAGRIVQIEGEKLLFKYLREQMACHLKIQKQGY